MQKIIINTQNYTPFQGLHTALAPRFIVHALILFAQPLQMIENYSQRKLYFLPTVNLKHTH